MAPRLKVFRRPAGSTGAFAPRPRSAAAAGWSAVATQAILFVTRKAAALRARDGGDRGRPRSNYHGERGYTLS